MKWNLFLKKKRRKWFKMSKLMIDDLRFSTSVAIGRKGEGPKWTSWSFFLLFGTWHKSRFNRSRYKVDLQRPPTLTHAHTHAHALLVYRSHAHHTLTHKQTRERISLPFTLSLFWHKSFYLNSPVKEWEPKNAEEKEVVFNMKSSWLLKGHERFSHSTEKKRREAKNGGEKIQAKA